jgi:glycyl-tRNA synthetase beta chain
MSELLVELHSEEIPARMQARAAENLAEQLGGQLADLGLTHEPIPTFAAPQRLTAVVRGLPERQPDVQVERRGPRTDAPQKAIDGFLGSLGDVDIQLTEQVDKKGTFLLARFVRPGQPTAAVLGPAIEAVLARFPWPKSMRWGGGDVRWVRPLRHILCLLNGVVIPVRFGTVEAGADTYGHRFMAPGPIRVASFDAYAQAVHDAKVVLDPSERRRLILKRAQALAEGEGLTVEEDAELVEEIAGLVEWPVPLIGTIDERFMALPAEVLVTSMRQHQKYLALRRADGALANRFVVVANVEASDGGAAIVAGNERVLRARLWDAEFFWQADRCTPLAERCRALEGIVLHAKLGSVGDKVQRLEELAPWLGSQLEETFGVTPHRGDYAVAQISELFQRAAALCKADLVTAMVGEFPELQGVMGRYYALHDGELPPVADAIAEHYKPAGPTERTPSAPVSVALALADKLDTLAGFFAVGERPTGSKDPFALRRAGLGVIRIVLANDLRLNLRPAVGQALEGYGDRFDAEVRAHVSDEVLAFLADRLNVELRDSGIRHDLLDAVLAVGQDDDLVRLVARVHALRDFLASDVGANLFVAFKRASNILRIEEKKDGRRYGGEPSGDLLVEPDERALWSRLRTVRNEIDLAVSGEDWAGAMAAVASLRGPVDAFFERVRVNADDPALRTNRLLLLNRIRDALARVADLDRIGALDLAAGTEAGRAAPVQALAGVGDGQD